uniref:Uncharacterized protein n=1 Tax=Daphnia galeata TaxID=27404 RepID=A0A8J2RHG3_9CRUS|nr:unnamed protein product [Daphnia galeata]
MDPPDGVQMIPRYQNDEQQTWQANFDQLTGIISESNKELAKELSKEMKNAMFGFMDIVGKAFVNTNKKVEEIDCQVQEVASQMEKNTSQVAQSDKRIDFLEAEIRRLEHLQKNSSRSEQQKDKDNEEKWRQKTQPIHKTKEKEIRVHRSRDSYDKIRKSEAKRRDRERESESEEWKRQQKRKRESGRASKQRSHESSEKKCYSPEKHKSSSHRFRPPVLSGSKIGKGDSNVTYSNVISRQQPGGIPKNELIILTEAQLQSLMKGSDCVKFIGKLILASFPGDYFLKKENTFKAAISSHQEDKFFEIVSNKYKQIIQRRGHPPKHLTKEEMSEVMGNKIVNYRTDNRHLIK